jgi:endonuclease YncB( thermonuclease family)
MGFQRTAAFALTSALLAGAAQPAVGESLVGPVPALVTQVIDGDTFQVRARIWLGHEVATRVRLAGVDAPESAGACPRERRLAGEATAFVSAKLGLVDGETSQVWLRDIHYGKYAGRIVARVELDGGEDLGQALLAAGLAQPYDGGRRQPWCEVILKN